MRLGVAAAYVDGRFVDGDVAVADGTVAAVGRAPAGRGLAVPGFVDLQVNGFGGVDLLTADRHGYEQAGRALLATGVTAYQPTFISAAVPQLDRGLATVREASRDRAGRHAGPRILGAHLEGPFLAREQAGTHPVAHLRRPDAGLLTRLLASGVVTMVTLAPELPGALDLVDLLAERGVVVSVGHSQADASAAGRAFDRGARAVTHLFNAMRDFSPRDPGIVATALSRDDVFVGVIVDGVHLADETVLMAWRAAGRRLMLVTDAMAAAGRGDGTYPLGDVTVRVSGGAARRSDGRLAGSVLTMDAAVRNLVALGVPETDAIRAATATPARTLGRDDVGIIRPGGPADLVVLDDRLEVQDVLVGGRQVG